MSLPKAFLCSQDGTVNFPIVKKITTIGCANCDITLDSNVDEQHALIEYIDEENCFILQDLNSSSGTFVNECRIQNAAVRLVEQDTIRFGLNTEPFQFVVQSQFMTIPPINVNGSQRSVQLGAGQHLQIITQTVPSRSLLSQSQTAPGNGGATGTSFYLTPLPSGSLITINNQTQAGGASGGIVTSSPPQLKPPQGIRSRPISAGVGGSPTVRRFSKETGISQASASSKMNVMAKGLTTTNGTASAVSFDVLGPVVQNVDSDTYRLQENPDSARVCLLEREIRTKTKEIRELREKLAFMQNQRKDERMSQLGTCNCKATATVSMPQLASELDIVKKEKCMALAMVTQLQKDLSTKDVSMSRLAREIEALKRELKKYESARRDSSKTAAEHDESTRGDWRRAEHDELIKEKSVAVGLVNQMQKDLSNKEATISRMAREMELFKRDLKECQSARKDLEEKLRVAIDSRAQDEDRALKDKELVVIRSKFKATEQKVIDLSNQIMSLKNELEEAQKESQKSTVNEKKLRDELEHVKLQYLDMQSAERIVRIDLEQMKRAYESFRNLVIQTIFSTPGAGQPSSDDLSNEDLVAKWKEMTRERNHLYENIEELKKSVTAQVKTRESIEAAIKAFETQIEAIETYLSTEGRRSDKIEAQLTALKSLEIGESLSRLRELVANLYSNEICWQTEIESAFLNSFPIETSTSASITTWVTQIKSQMDAQQEEKSALEAKIRQVEESIEARVNEAIESESGVVASKIAAVQASKDEFYRVQIESLESQHKELTELVKADFTVRIDQLTEERDSLATQVESLNGTITQMNLEIDAKVTESNQTLAVIKSDFEVAQSELKTQIEQYSTQIVNYTAKIEELTANLTSSQTSYNNELELFKEQVKQHSLTIVELERELNAYQDRENEYVETIETLRRKKESIQTQIIPTVQAVRLVDNSLEVESMGRTIDLLRGECQTYKIRLSEQDEFIKTLRRDLMTASAKLTDVQGEVTEKQKRELEKNRLLVIEQQRELSESRSQMAKLSEIVDKQSKQVESLQTELGKSKSMIDKYRLTSEENGLLSIELKSKLDGMESQVKKFECVRKEEGKITSELTALGAQCKGERHEQVITRQREALNELRQRVKQLESTRPQLPAQQQQMQQQIMLLKKQLAEVRASQALTDDIAKQAQLARGQGDHATLMIEEKSAHYETQSALEASEESYLTLLKTLGTLLNLTEMDGLRLMTGLSVEERDQLLTERSKAIEALCVKIKSLQEKIHRKDELLREYELDLARLRQAEFVLQKKSEQLDEIEVFSRTKEEEIEYLKESLKATKTDLDRERQINGAIKEKKPLSTVTTRTEKVRRGSTDTLHHHCPPGDSKAASVKKEMSEKIKRKDYELKTLKQEIKTKADEISNLTSRLTIVENGAQK